MRPMQTTHVKPPAVGQTGAAPVAQGGGLLAGVEEAWSWRLAGGRVRKRAETVVFFSLAFCFALFAVCTFVSCASSVVLPMIHQLTYFKRHCAVI